MENKSYKYMVCARCFTYNHAPFIESALEGFAMQQTTFPTAFVVVDDCSPDGEPEIIKKWAESNLDFQESGYAYKKVMDYGELLFAHHKTNGNASFAILLLKENHYQLKKSKLPYLSEWINHAKYLAVCEGDDYWIHPQKLQMQVDFLESHPNHSACIHAYRRDTIRGESVISTNCYKYSNSIETIPLEDIICNKNMFCATASWMYCASAWADYPEWAKRGPVGDKPFKLVICARGHIGYINELMSVYRVGVPGSWTQRVLRNRESEKKTRDGIIKIMKDFDQWTEGKYHQYVRRTISYYYYSYWKTILIVRPYQKMKKLLHRS